MKKTGFAFVELMVVVAIIAIAVIVSLSYSTILLKKTSLNKTIATRDRILSGIRNLAGLPASLRTSMRAAANGRPANPQLLACAGGNPLNSCQSGTVFPLILYSPLINRSASGEILGIQPITSALGSATPMRLDLFGVPCTEPGPDCPLLVFTSFKAQCGPAPLDPTAPPPTSLELVPQATCTIADVIEVTYYVQLDPLIASADPSLTSFVTLVSGSVITLVLDISGNFPQ
jgi:hypothetical protein